MHAPKGVAQCTSTGTHNAIFILLYPVLCKKFAFSMISCFSSSDEECPVQLLRRIDKTDTCQTRPSLHLENIDSLQSKVSEEIQTTTTRYEIACDSAINLFNLIVLPLGHVKGGT